VFPQVKSLAGTYNMRLFATVKDKPAETAFTDFIIEVIYDPCYISEARQEAISPKDQVVFRDAMDV